MQLWQDAMHWGNSQEDNPSVFLEGMETLQGNLGGKFEVEAKSFCLCSPVEEEGLSRSSKEPVASQSHSRFECGCHAQTEQAVLMAYFQ